MIILDGFISLDEAAKLENINYDSLKKAVQRNPNKFGLKTEQSEKGGKDRVYILISSLSSKAIRLYDANKTIEKQNLREVSSENKFTWYMNVDLNMYIEANKTQYYEAVELKKKIEDYFNITVKDKTEYTEEYASKLGMSGRNFRRKVDAYIEGAAWALQKHEEDGQNYDYFKVLALCRAPNKLKGDHISLTDEMKVEIQNIWFNPMFAANRRTITKLYKKILEIGEKKDWLLIPSYITVTRYVKQLNEKYSNERFLAEFGDREFKRKKMIKVRRDTSLLQVMELVQGDAHTFDCWVKITRQNGTVTAIKPYLVALIDTRSRCLVGWAICEVPNNQVIKKCLMHMMYKKENSPIEGVPRILLIDNGKDWTAKTLTGRPRTERITLDGEIRGFYKSIGIQDDMRALPYQAWTKGQIERFFRTVCNDFTSSFDSYTGTLTGSLTIGKVKKDIKGMLTEEKLLDMEGFAKLFNKWLNEDYHLRKHRGLKEQGEESPTPYDVFMSADKYEKAAPPIEYARLLLLESVERHVTATGFSLFTNNYHHELLGPFIDKKVIVRYSMEDLNIVQVYSCDGVKICEAKANQWLNPLAGAEDEFLKQHIMSQNRQKKNVKKTLEYLQTPYEERLKKKQTVILPELSGEPQKVVSMPNDKLYTEELKSKNKKKEKGKNNYLMEQGKKALEDINLKAEGYR